MTARGGTLYTDPDTAPAATVGRVRAYRARERRARVALAWAAGAVAVAAGRLLAGAVAWGVL